VKFGFVVRPRADRDIDEIADYLVEQSGLDTGLRFLQLRSVRTFRVSERFDKFLIFYQPHRDRIEILRVLHGAQDLVTLFQREGVE